LYSAWQLICAHQLKASPLSCVGGVLEVSGDLESFRRCLAAEAATAVRAAAAEADAGTLRNH